MTSIPKICMRTQQNEIRHSKPTLALVSPSSHRIRVGVIGYGYWGPQIVRNFQTWETSEVVAVCDTSPKSLQRVQQAYPEIKVTQDFDELLRSTQIDAIAVVTPVRTHYEFAKMALENGKHVFGSWWITPFCLVVP